MIQPEASREEFRHGVLGDRCNGGAGGCLLLQREPVPIAQHRPASVVGVCADDHAGHERRAGVCRGEPVACLEVNERDGVRNETVEIEPPIPLCGLQHKLRLLLDDAKAPARLQMLPARAERERLEQAAEARANISEQVRIVGAGAQDEMRSRALHAGRRAPHPARAASPGVPPAGAACFEEARPQAPSECVGATERE